jgi:hypothetical protein
MLIALFRASEELKIAEALINLFIYLFIYLFYF